MATEVRPVLGLVVAGFAVPGLAVAGFEVCPMAVAAAKQVTIRILVLFIQLFLRVQM
jgi:hypothetical protein